MSTGWDAGEPLPEGNFQKIYTVKITGSKEKEGMTSDNRKYEYIEIELTEKNGEFCIKARHFIKRNREGKLLSQFMSGYTNKLGKEIPPTLLYEIRELIGNKLTSEEYEARKRELGDTTKEFFIGASFDIPVREIHAKDGNTYWIPVFTAQKIKDAEYKAGKEDTESSENDVDPNDLPF